MHQAHRRLADRVPEERHLGLQDAAAVMTGGNSELQHLLVLQEDVTVRSHGAHLDAPVRVHGLEPALEILPGGDATTAETRHPEEPDPKTQLQTRQVGAVFHN